MLITSGENLQAQSGQDRGRASSFISLHGNIFRSYSFLWVTAGKSISAPSEDPQKSNHWQMMQHYTERKSSTSRWENLQTLFWSTRTKNLEHASIKGNSPAFFRVIRALIVSSIMLKSVGYRWSVSWIRALPWYLSSTDPACDLGLWKWMEIWLLWLRTTKPLIRIDSLASIVFSPWPTSSNTTLSPSERFTFITWWDTERRRGAFTTLLLCCQRSSSFLWRLRQTSCSHEKLWVCLTVKDCEQVCFAVEFVATICFSAADEPKQQLSTSPAAGHRGRLITEQRCQLYYLLYSTSEIVFQKIYLRWFNRQDHFQQFWKMLKVKLSPLAENHC